MTKSPNDTSVIHITVPSELRMTVKVRAMQAGKSMNQYVSDKLKEVTESIIEPWPITKENPAITAANSVSPTKPGVMPSTQQNLSTAPRSKPTSITNPTQYELPAKTMLDALPEKKRGLPSKDGWTMTQVNAYNQAIDEMQANFKRGENK